MTWHDVVNWLLSLILCVALVECAVLLPFARVLAKVHRTVGKTARVLPAKSISDHWKEQVMLAYAGAMFVCSLKLAVFLLCLGAVAVLLIYLGDQIAPGFGDFIVSWWGGALTLVLASLYLAIRKFLPHARIQSSRSAPPSPSAAGGADRGTEL